MSKLNARKDKHYVETKVFKVYDPTGTDVLTDENGAEFTVEMYAPQSKRMRDFADNFNQQAILQNARTNGAAGKNAKLQTKRGVRIMAHAIKAWHPVSPDGEFIAEYETLKADALADLLMPSDDEASDISWLTDQLVEFFNKGNFVVMEAATEIAPKATAKVSQISTKTSAAS